MNRHVCTCVAMALAGLVASALPALAWSDLPLGETAPATSEVAVWPYPSERNFCPGGLRPVSVGGVICCGVPNRSEPQPVHRQATRGGRYIATGKGFGQGYFTGD